MVDTEELNQALYELRAKVQDSISLAIEAREKVGALIRSSHLVSTLTLLEQDIGLRRVLDLNK